MKRRGISLLEIAFTLVIVGLIMGPILHLLTSTNRESSSSMFEVMATSYSRELAEQLLNLNERPGFALLCAAAKKGLPELLEELNPELARTDSETPGRIPLGGEKVFLLASPLIREFQERKILVEAVPAPSGKPAGEPDYFKVVIRLSWSLPGEPKPDGVGMHKHESVVFLHQEQ